MKTISPGSRRRGAADKMLFVVAALAGMAAIVGLKLAGVEQLLITVPPVAIIVLYAVVVTAVKRFRLREDLAGDNCYYLGFLYTLVSLALALILFVRGERDVDSLIGNFGIALFTTIAGLAARVILAQFREDPLEVEREVRVELSEAVARFKGALNNAVNDLEAFRRANEQSIEDAVHAMLERHSSLFEYPAEKLSEATRRLTDASGTFAEEAAAFSTGARKLVAALSKLEERIVGVDVPADLLEREIKPLRQAVDGLARSLSKRAEVESVQAVNLEAFAERLQAAGDVLATKASEFAQTVQVVPHSARQLNAELLAASRTVAEHVEALATAMRSERDERGGAREHLAQELRETAALLAAHRKTLAEAQTKETHDAQRRSEDQEQVHQASIALLREHNTALATQLEQSRTLMRRFEDGLVEVADEITRRVDGAVVGRG